jgi:spore germination cell wall hydrolase CwlJ-like protein
VTTSNSYENVLAALCLWREARGQSAAAKAAILAVIRNRVADKRWPNTLTGVILQPLQFSSFNSGDPNATQMPNPKNAADWAAWTECCNVVDTPLIADPTMGATNYESCEPGKLPSWAQPSKLTVQIGPFRFYKL